MGTATGGILGILGICNQKGEASYRRRRGRVSASISLYRLHHAETFPETVYINSIIRATIQTFPSLELKCIIPPVAVCRKRTARTARQVIQISSSYPCPPTSRPEIMQHSGASQPNIVARPNTLINYSNWPVIKLNYVRT
jgi:hypothetical protein